MKNFLSGIIAALLVLPLVGCGLDARATESPGVAGYSDVTPDAWYAKAVEYCHGQGLMTGADATLFVPDTITSRAMLSTILYRLSGTPFTEQSPVFADVSSDAWYSDAVAWAASQGIMSGYGNGRFGPNDAVSREQGIAVLWRNAGSPPPANTATSFHDRDTISSYAVTAVDWARESGIVNGTADGHFDPKSNITRGETAVLLHRYLSLQDTPTNTPEDTVQHLTITVGNRVFEVTLYESASVDALMEQLPMTIQMSELNGNEKYYFMSQRLPANPNRPEQIRAGDLMLSGNNCLVLFYKDFTSSYSYTPLGHIEDVAGLYQLLGNGRVEIAFR